MAFNNEAALKAALVAACIRSVDNAGEKVYEELSGNLNQYYTEFYPKEYIRTGALFGSLNTTGTMPIGSGAVAEMYFTTPSYNTGSWSGEEVLDTAMHGSHGGYVSGTAIWDDTMDNLGKEAGIKALLLNELKKQGLNIK